jgi:hypothetical protein
MNVLLLATDSIGCIGRWLGSSQMIICRVFSLDAAIRQEEEEKNNNNNNNNNNNIERPEI